MESARLDGAGDIRTAFQIYFPLCKPILATISLFYGINYWNNWFNAVMLLDNKKLYPLQMLLFRIQSDIRMLNELTAYGVPVATPPNEGFKMATVVVTIGPLVFLYPFLQRYFVKGIMIGSIKG
jgi:putative aldouronate transport system permease protein